MCLVFVCVCMYAVWQACRYVCIYVSMYLCIYASMYVCMYMLICVHLSASGCVCVCVCVYVCVSESGCPQHVWSWCSDSRRYEDKPFEGVVKTGPCSKLVLESGLQTLCCGLGEGYLHHSHTKWGSRQFTPGSPAIINEKLANMSPGCLLVPPSPVCVVMGGAFQVRMETDFSAKHSHAMSIDIFVIFCESGASMDAQSWKNVINNRSVIQKEQVWNMCT